jgi:MFS family permease
MIKNNKNIYGFFFFGYSLSKFCDQLLIFLLPVLVYKLSHDISKSGTIFAIEWAARLIILPFAGSIVDRFSARKTVIFLDFFKSLIFLMTGFLFYFLKNDIFFNLNIIAIVLGIVSEICYVSNEVLLLEIFESSTNKSQKISQIADQIILISSPGLAAFVINLFDFSLIIFAMGSLFILNPMILLFKTIENHTQKNHSKIFDDMKLGFKFIFTDKRILRISFLTFFLNLCFGLVLISLNYFIVTVYGKTEKTIALLTIFAGIASTIGLKFIKSESLNFKFFILWSILFLLCFILFNTSLYLPVFFVVYSLFSVSISNLTLFIRSERIKLIPKDHLGKLVGCMIFINSCSMPVAGYLIYLFGSNSLSKIWFLAILFLTIAIIFSIKNFKKYNVTLPQEEAQL